MSWFNKTDKLIDVGEKVVSGVMSGVDKAWFTDQEKATVTTEIVKMHSDFVKETLSESSIRSQTRRVVAFGILGLFSVSFLIGLAVAVFIPEKLDGVIAVAKVYDISWMGLMVAGFFFGSHLARGVAGSVGAKK